MKRGNLFRPLPRRIVADIASPCYACIMNERAPFPPAAASPPYDAFVERYGLHMLKEGGDLQIVDGDLALTKDRDLMLGDKSYNALFRLAEHWRHSAPHVAVLMDLLDQMAGNLCEAQRRLDDAAVAETQRKQEAWTFGASSEFLRAWHSHYDEEGGAVFGQEIYAGCIIMLASNALLRFWDDLDRPEGPWRNCRRQFGGRSVGEILIASANGFRHADEWVKTRPMTAQQRRSADVLTSTLGAPDISQLEPSPPGRCQEVIRLLAAGEGFDGFNKAMLGFAQDVALVCRQRPT